jgi:hypothetical protein
MKHKVKKCTTLRFLYLLEAWLKAELVIDSCKTLDQLDTATKYVNLLNVLFSDTDVYYMLMQQIKQKNCFINNFQ